MQLNNLLHQATQKETIYSIINLTLQFGVSGATHSNLNYLTNTYTLTQKTNLHVYFSYRRRKKS